jgi:hypothetical protein
MPPILPTPAPTGDDTNIGALHAADRPEREVALPLLTRALRGGETIVCDKGYAGREFATAVQTLGATIAGPPAATNPTTVPTSRLSGNESNRSSPPAKTS